MDKLAETVIEAHGGLAHWKTFKTLSAHLIQGGALWALKNQASVLDDTNVTVDLIKQEASHTPFGDAGRKSLFHPERVALLTSTGDTIGSLENPRASFAGHTLETPWTKLQLAYFAGCAMWTYLNMPFLLSWPGMEAHEIEPWQEKGETWRRLHVHFPQSVATHSGEQTLYVADDGLLKRHDYNVEIAGNTPGAHYISNYIDVSGIKIPTKRRIFPRQPDGQPTSEPLVVSIDLDRISLS